MRRPALVLLLAALAACGGARPAAPAGPPPGACNAAGAWALEVTWTGKGCLDVPDWTRLTFRVALDGKHWEVTAQGPEWGERRIDTLEVEADGAACRVAVAAGDLLLELAEQGGRVTGQGSLEDRRAGKSCQQRFTLQGTKS